MDRLIDVHPNATGNQRMGYEKAGNITAHGCKGSEHPTAETTCADEKRSSGWKQSSTGSRMLAGSDDGVTQSRATMFRGMLRPHDQADGWAFSIG